MASSITFQDKLTGAGLWPLMATGIETLQVNVGKRCNQACKHCHVEAGPNRTESMTRETAGQVIDALRRHPDIKTLDITGGAPELNPNFRYLVTEAKALGRHVLDRCNLTVLFEPGQEDTARFLRDNDVEVVASLPYYLAQRTDAQRGLGVFDLSIEGLRLLNSLGYAPGRRPGPQPRLQPHRARSCRPPRRRSRRNTSASWIRRYGIAFTHLYTITNMPISRFLHFLERNGQPRAVHGEAGPGLQPRRRGGRDVPRPASASAGTACCTTVTSTRCSTCRSRMACPAMSATSTAMRWLAARSRSGAHCFGCTAGAGSSCGGATA